MMKFTPTWVLASVTIWVEDSNCKILRERPHAAWRRITQTEFPFEADDRYTTGDTIYSRRGDWVLVTSPRGAEIRRYSEALARLIREATDRQRWTIGVRQGPRCCHHGVPDADDGRPSCSECECSPSCSDSDVRVLLSQLKRSWSPGAWSPDGVAQMQACAEIIAIDICRARREEARANQSARALRAVERILPSIDPPAVRAQVQQAIYTFLASSREE